jgi:hypothetical protein
MTKIPKWRLTADWFDVCRCDIPCRCEFASRRPITVPGGAGQSGGETLSGIVQGYKPPGGDQRAGRGNEGWKQTFPLRSRPPVRSAREPLQDFSPGSTPWPPRPTCCSRRGGQGRGSPNREHQSLRLKFGTFISMLRAVSFLQMESVNQVGLLVVSRANSRSLGYRHLQQQCVSAYLRGQDINRT